MLLIQPHNCPDTTYFRQSEVSPYIKNGVLHVVDGCGTRRSWGSPWCKSEVSELETNVIMVSVSWKHKHNWGHQDYYFVKEGDAWKRRRKNHTSVLVAYMLKK